MENEKRPELDWFSAPTGEKEDSLWACLHDADLVRLTSDHMDRTARIEFSIRHLLKFHGLPADMRFVLALRGVKSARVTQSFPWPGDFAIPHGASREEQQSLTADYWAKWREESISWLEFESKLSTDPRAPEVSNADYLIDEEGNFALKLQLMVDDDTYCELILRAERVEVCKSDGQPLSLAQFIQLGIDYWDAFEDRSKARPEISTAQ